MFALTLLFLIFTNAQYISNSSGLYIFNAKLSQIKSLLLPETIINVIGNFDVDGGFTNFYINKIIMKSFSNSIPQINYIKLSSILKIINFEYYEGFLNLYYYKAFNTIRNLVLHTTLNEFKNNINYFGSVNENSLFGKIEVINIEPLYESSEQESEQESEQQDTNEYNYNSITINRKTNLSEINLSFPSHTFVNFVINNDFIIDEECLNLEFNFIIDNNSTLIILKKLNIRNILLSYGYLEIHENNVNIIQLDCNNYELNQFLNRFEINDNFNVNINSGLFKLSSMYTCNKLLNGFTINNNNEINLCKSNDRNYFSSSCNSQPEMNCP